jgi:hypothetical protein
LTSGRLTLLVFYLAFAIGILASVDAPSLSQHFLDDLAFRAAWLTLTQLPLVYLLSTKRGPLNFVAGLSYERINWLHRWIARFLLITATVHVTIMKSSTSTLDILYSDEKSMSVVRYGIGAYSTLLWIAVTSILPLRRCSYRLFYINHLISTVAFLVILFQHIPTYARAPIYLAASFLGLDKALVCFYFVRNNISVQPLPRRVAKFGRMSRGKKLVAGYAVELLPPSSMTLALLTQPLEHATTIIRIANVPIRWRPGQHIRIYIPALGRWESHPFTPANCSTLAAPPLPPRKDVERDTQPRAATKQRSDILLMIKAQKGWTRRLAAYHKDWLLLPCPNASGIAPSSLVAYVDGPYGSSPRWEEYENLVLLATGTGISFTLSVLDWLEQVSFTGVSSLLTRSVRVVWMVRHLDPQLQESVEKLLERYAAVLRSEGVEVAVDVYVSCRELVEEVKREVFDPFAHLRQHREGGLLGKPPLRIRNPEEIYAEWDREAETEMRGMALDDVEPSVTEMEGEDWHGYETDTGSDVSETDTLVAASDEVKEDDPFADSYAIRAERPEKVENEGATCQCARIQNIQQRKVEASHKTQEIINRYHGIRCDISNTLSSAILHESTQKTMVAVCGSGETARTARRAVSLINWTYALGKRTASAELHIEGGGGTI